MRVKISRGDFTDISTYAPTETKEGNYAFYEYLERIINTVIKPDMLFLMSDFTATIMLEDLMKLRELHQGQLFLPMIICYIIHMYFSTYYKLCLWFL
jgi:hypothetical protein